MIVVPPPLSEQTVFVTGAALEVTVTPVLLRAGTTVTSTVLVIGVQAPFVIVTI